MIEILPMINKLDLRSAVSWCKKNELEIFKDSSGKYVIEGEFNFAYNRKVIERYKSKYGNDWEMMFDLCSDNKLHKSTITERGNQLSGSSRTSGKRYIPQGNRSMNFSKRLND